MKTSSPLTPLAKAAQPALVKFARWRWTATLCNPPIFYALATLASAGVWLFGSHFWVLAGLVGLVIWPALAVVHFELSGVTWMEWREQSRRGKSHPGSQPSPSQNSD